MNMPLPTQSVEHESTSIPIKKSKKIDLYTINNNGEYANIAIREWENKALNGADIQYQGLLMIHSSYGTFSYHFSQCGMPFRKFLIKLNYCYLMGKLSSGILEEFDGEATFKSAIEQLLQYRICLKISKSQAREDYDELISLEDEIKFSSNDAYRILSSVNSTSNADELIETKDRACLRAFWDELWVNFIQELKNELTHCASGSTYVDDDCGYCS